MKPEQHHFVSIGIPFYNAEPYLADAIRSVFAQTQENWELILLNDGSTDRSLDIAMAIRDPRVRVISDGENRRLPFRLNQITDEAKYDFIGRMDADDLISPNRFEKQLHFLQSNPRTDLVTAGICSLSKDNRPIGVRKGNPGIAITGRSLLLGKNSIVHAAILGRKSWFLRNPYDETSIRTEDYELWLRAFSRNDFNIHILTDQLYYYREEDNVTANRLLTAYASQRNLYKKYGFIGFNRFETLSIIGRSYIKSLIVRALSAMNRMDILLNKRNTSIENEERITYFNSEISRIMKTSVPGLD